MRKLLTLLVAASFAALSAYAQGVIRGKVTDENGEPVPGASVILKGTNVGVNVGADGMFAINSPTSTAVLEISSINFATQTITAQVGKNVEVKLAFTQTNLDEVIVTGVAQGTARKKASFAITKVSSEKLNVVPGIDASQSLRGKVAGITINQSQGDQGAAVFLRGAKSVFGNISPLIVIDGFQTGLSLSDLNPEDIESVEVVKGAAASALYGSRAEGGVIQVITKNGKGTGGKVQITIDNEVGINNIERTPPLTKLHPFRVNTDGSFVLNGFQRSYDYQSNGFSLNLHPYQMYYDNTKALLNNRVYYNNFISVNNSFDKYNIYASFYNQYRGGALDPIDPNKRRTAKFNFGFRPTNKIETGITLQYYNDIRPSSAVNRDNQGTFFAATLQFEPFINLKEKDADGDYAVTPTGFEIQNANLQNPLYEWSARDYTNNGDNFLIGGNFKYKFTRNLNIELSGSINKENYRSTNYYPIGYKTRLPSPTLNDGYYGIYSSENVVKNTNAQLNYTNQFGDFEIGGAAKFIYEEYKFEDFSASGYRLTAPVYDLGVTDPTTRSINSSWNKTVNYGYFLNGRVGWREKIFFDGLGRVDQSSRFGSEVATAFFYRGSMAYRVTQDIDLGPFNELKIRAAFGTAGSIPPYGAKDSRVVITSTGGIQFQQRENTALDRSVTEELEVGIDGTLFNRINFQFNYAKANSKNDFIVVPPFPPIAGSAGIYGNLGKVKSNSWEAEINGNVIQGRTFTWNTGFTFSRVRSEITDLGEIPDFTSGGLFRKTKGASAYAFYGQKVARSLDQLDVDKGSGYVTNIVGQTGMTLSDFTVNGKGFVVLASGLGTAGESPLFLANPATGNNFLLGRGEPDFQIGFSNTFSFFDKLALYVLLDWKQGGLKYDQTYQYLTFDNRTKAFEEFAMAGLPISFLQKVYNGNSLTDFWLEDNSYLFVREVSLSYNFGKIANVVKNARLAVIGRNLLSISDYNGSNLEGYYEYYPYPVYRTYSAKLTLNF